jgi:hypothetical protein
MLALVLRRLRKQLSVVCEPVWDAPCPRGPAPWRVVRGHHHDNAGRQHDEERESRNRYSTPVHASIVRLGTTRVNGEVGGNFDQASSVQDGDETGFAAGCPSLGATCCGMLRRQRDQHRADSRSDGIDQSCRDALGVAAGPSNGAADIPYLLRGHGHRGRWRNVCLRPAHGQLPGSLFWHSSGDVHFARAWECRGDGSRNRQREIRHEYLPPG